MQEYQLVRLGKRTSKVLALVLTSYPSELFCVQHHNVIPSAEVFNIKQYSTLITKLAT